MARAFAKAFYNSAAWIKTSRAYAESRFWICERCHRPIKGQYIVHHKIHLSPENIHDPDISLNWSNLMLLCNDCHNAVHHHQKKLKRKVLFSPDGQVIGLKDPPSGS